MYQQKYYKEIESCGIRWRLEIWQDTEADLEAAEIGPVLQGLRLVVQGDQASIDTPIVKTSLEMVFVDAPELEVGRTDRKCGDWEEFYTSSATEYQVRLYKNGVIEWTGYVTPDSFEEELRYRGSITIIARDNLGTLQDTTCDLRDLQNADGKVYIADVIDRAFQVSTCGMALNYDYNTFPFACVESPQWEYSGKVFYQMVDAAYLGEMSWWEALEAVLYSIGAVMRYLGGNQFFVSALRDLPKMGNAEWWDVPVKPATFLAYGHRELVPPVKSITETQEWEAKAETDIESVGDYEGTATLAVQNITLHGPTSDAGPNFNVPAWGYSNQKNKEQTAAANSALLNVNNYARLAGEDSEAYGAWDDESIIYYALNAREEKPIAFSRALFSERDKVNIHFRVDKPVTLTTATGNAYQRVLNLPVKGWTAHGTGTTIEYYISHTDRSGVVRYLGGNGEWSTQKYKRGYVLEDSLLIADKPQASVVKFEIGGIPSAGTISLIIARIYNTQLEIQTRYDCTGIWMRVTDISLEPTIPEDLALTKKRTFTTNYSDKYAVRLTRDPKLAVNATTLPEVAYIPNAILMEGGTQYLGSDDWVWMHGREWDEIPTHTGAMLTRLIHQQLLCWHSKPNNLLTGEIACLDPTFNALYEWNGKKHYLISGTLNCLTGRMEGATLREFERYDRLWETYAEQDVYEVEESSTEQVVDIVVRSQKALTANDIKGLGGHLLNYGMETSGSKYTYHVGVVPTNEPFERVVTIDSARVLLTRGKRDDYSIEYGNDYN